MSKLSFITLMRYYAWGGSEELWQKIALHAVKNNHTAEAHMTSLTTGHPKAQELIKAGISARFRNEMPTIPDRVLRKLRLQQYNINDVLHYWKNSLKDKKDLYIISGGTTFDCVPYANLFEALNRENLPYVYISQHHFEHGSIDKEYTDLMISIFEKAKKVYFVAQKNLDIAQLQLRRVLPNAEVIFNPINLPAKVCLENTYNTDQTLHVACVARLECANKGHDIMLRVLASEKWKDRDIHFSFYGKGPDEAFIKHLTEYLGLNKKVSFHGHVDNIQDVWKNHHVLMMSSFAEGTPLSLMEAMACGRSAVVTDVGGNAEWITDGYNGFVANAPVPSSLDDALERMWQQRATLPELGRRCYDTFMKKYPEDAIEYLFNKLRPLLPA